MIIQYQKFFLSIKRFFWHNSISENVHEYFNNQKYQFLFYAKKYDNLFSMYNILVVWL